MLYPFFPQYEFSDMLTFTKEIRRLYLIRYYSLRVFLEKATAVIWH